MYAAAAPKNAAEITRLLLAKGANVQPRALFSDWPSQISSEPRAQYRATGGLNALMYAARAGCYGCVDALIAAGADANLPTPEGVTPLMIAIDGEYNEVAKLLLDRGANPHVWDWWGRTALYLAVERKANALGAAGGRGGPAPLGAGGGRGGAGRGGEAPPARAGGPAPVSSVQLINALLAADVDPEPGTQHAPPQPRRQQRPLRRKPTEHGLHAFVRARRRQTTRK